MIHYHCTPCGGPRIHVDEFLQGRHALIPFPRQEDLPTAAAVCESFCFDNGAFTAWKSGNPITDWQPYFDWVEFWHKHPGFDWALIPDVIDGGERENEALISEWFVALRHKLDPWRVGVPIWHLHESIERLVKLARYWPRVALGSSGEFRTPGSESWKRRMAEAMNAICDQHGRPMCKLHGLRMLSPKIFTKYPLASADSTNAVRNSSNYKRFGMYPPPVQAAGMASIARRIEAHQSAMAWVRRDQQKSLGFNSTESTPQTSLEFCETP